MGWFNKMQKRFDPLGYKLRKADPIREALFGPLEGGGDQQQAAQSMFAAPRPYTGFGQQQAPMQMQPQMPPRQLVGAPRQMGQPMGVQPGQPMGQPLPMGQPGAPRPLVGTPRLQQQATVNALRTPTPIV
jgi:hypothetical protein